MDSEHGLQRHLTQDPKQWCNRTVPCYVEFADITIASRLRLHSANRHQHIVPRCRLNTYGRRAFSIAGPTVWNSLPDELRDPACGSDSFKQFLKTSDLSLLM